MREIHVGIGQTRVSRDPLAVLSAYGLGSCVCVCACDPEVQVAGMSHILLPKKGKNSAPATGCIYADVAIRQLFDTMEKRGASKDAIVVRLTGGSNIMEGTGVKQRIGSRNTKEVLRILGDMKVRVIEKDLGGDHSRSVKFFVKTGEMKVHSRKHNSDGGGINGGS